MGVYFPVPLEQYTSYSETICPTLQPAAAQALGIPSTPTATFLRTHCWHALKNCVVAGDIRKVLVTSNVQEMELEQSWRSI